MECKAVERLDPEQCERYYLDKNRESVYVPSSAALSSAFIVFVYLATQVYASDPKLAMNHR